MPTFQSRSRIRRVSGRKCGFSPLSSFACTTFRLHSRGEHPHKSLQGNPSHHRSVRDLVPPQGTLQAQVSLARKHFRIRRAREPTQCGDTGLCMQSRYTNCACVWLEQKGACTVQ